MFHCICESMRIIWVELLLGIHEQKGQAYSVESKANARHKLQYGCWWFLLAIFAFSGILKERKLFNGEDCWFKKHKIQHQLQPRARCPNPNPESNQSKCLLNNEQLMIWLKLSLKSAWHNLDKVIIGNVLKNELTSLWTVFSSIMFLMQRCEAWFSFEFRTV